MIIGKLHLNIIPKLLQEWYVRFFYFCILVLIGLLCFHNKIQAVIFQVMLYVDMEVNGVPLKVSGRSKEHSSSSLVFVVTYYSFSGPPQ